METPIERAVREITTIPVTGATGHLGRHVVQGLLEAGVGVRALVRNPALAGLPAEVEVVTALTEQVSRVVYLSSMSVRDAGRSLIHEHDIAELIS